MQYLWAIQIFDVAQYLRQLLHVMSVDRTEVADVHSLEDVLLLGYNRLQTVVETKHGFASFLVHDAHFAKHFIRLETQLVVTIRGSKVQQVLLHATYTAVDGHVVVVQQHDHAGVALAGVVQRLVAHAPGQGPVAHQRHDVVIAAREYVIG